MPILKYCFIRTGDEYINLIGEHFLIPNGDIGW